MGKLEAPEHAASRTADRRIAFERLVLEHGAALYRSARWLCGDPQVAEDLVQETFARAWRAFDALRETRAARAWLFVTLRREHARLHERQRPQGDGTPLESILSPHPGLDDRPEAWALRRALSALAVEYRDPLLLQVLGGFSCDEIGVALELSPQTVATRLFRARRRLRAALGGEPGRQDEGP
jgi:RNA polymerase sigma-70 factor (ECF subfamily)